MVDRRCEVCHKSHSNAQCFLLTCVACRKAWHHTCHRPPMTGKELLACIMASNRNDYENGVEQWKCRDCRPKSLIVLDESDDEIIEITPPVVPKSKSVVASRPAEATTYRDFNRQVGVSAGKAAHNSSSAIAPPATGARPNVHDLSSSFQATSITQPVPTAEVRRLDFSALQSRQTHALGIPGHGRSKDVPPVPRPVPRPEIPPVRPFNVKQHALQKAAVTVPTQPPNQTSRPEGPPPSAAQPQASSSNVVPTVVRHSGEPGQGNNAAFAGSRPPTTKTLEKGTRNAGLPTSSLIPRRDNGASAPSPSSSKTAASTSTTPQRLTGYLGHIEITSDGETETPPVSRLTSARPSSAAAAAVSGSLRSNSTDRVQKQQSLSFKSPRTPTSSRPITIDIDIDDAPPIDRDLLPTSDKRPDMVLGAAKPPYEPMQPLQSPRSSNKGKQPERIENPRDSVNRSADSLSRLSVAPQPPRIPRSPSVEVVSSPRHMAPSPVRAQSNFVDDDWYYNPPPEAEASSQAPPPIPSPAPLPIPPRADTGSPMHTSPPPADASIQDPALNSQLLALFEFVATNDESGKSWQHYAVRKQTAAFQPTKNRRKSKAQKLQGKRSGELLNYDHHSWMLMQAKRTH